MGHGLFSAKLLTDNSKQKGTICDLSETSLDACKKLFKHLSLNFAQVNFHHKNFFDLEESTKFDFLVMGEVLEHVEDGLGFVNKARRLLKNEER